MRNRIKNNPLFNKQQCTLVNPNKIKTMSTLTSSRRTGNQNSIEELQTEILSWGEKLNICSEEMTFLKHFLESGIFKDLSEENQVSLETHSLALEDIRSEKIAVQLATRNHRNDINGMMECEDVNCDAFYHSQHHDLFNRLQLMLQKFQEVKLHIYRFSLPFLSASVII